jgi:uncharacterized zinc-type alcohol dehydrogenase-like protein
VLIELHYAGICHSDIHTVRGEWGPQTYPLTVGHEMVGIVAEIGPQVTRHQVGDRVGVGTMVNSCRECVYCRNGQEQYCANGNIQTYASVDRWHHHAGRLLHPRCGHRGLRPQDPRRHPIRDRGPLLCAGITTYSPLRHWAAGPGKAVAVVGLGGLGHLGVKFAHALGRT